MKELVRKDDLAAAIGFGAALNFPWEMAHSLLYRRGLELSWSRHLVECGLASLADGAGVAVLFGIGAVAFRDPHWTEHRSPARLAVTALGGLIGSAIVEELALQRGWWSYGPAMPRVPGTDLGVSPLIQFMLLPVAILFGLLPWRWARRDRV